MHSRSLARELALLVLGQTSETDAALAEQPAMDGLLQKALDSLMILWRETLDGSAADLERAQQSLLDSELNQDVSVPTATVESHLRSSISAAEQVLNGLSACLDLPRLLLLADQEQIRQDALSRVRLVMERRSAIDARLDQVMEGWRLNRLPRIDRDILRLAVVDLTDLSTPAPVAISEAVELANRYSDEQGRRMINGVLRRFQNAAPTASA